MLAPADRSTPIHRPRTQQYPLVGHSTPESDRVHQPISAESGTAHRKATDYHIARYMLCALSRSADSSAASSSARRRQQQYRATRVTTSAALPAQPLRASDRPQYSHPLSNHTAPERPTSQHWGFIRHLSTPRSAHSLTQQSSPHTRSSVLSPSCPPAVCCPEGWRGGTPCVHARQSGAAAAAQSSSAPLARSVMRG